MKAFITLLTATIITAEVLYSALTFGALGLVAYLAIVAGSIYTYIHVSEYLNTIIRNK
jgi:hypothetical protein